MKPLVLTPSQQEDAIRSLLAVRRLGTSMAEVFAGSRGSEATEALRGAEAMVATIDHVLELLGSPPGA